MQIYLITNKVNGKRYVGQTIQSLRKRWSSHGSDAKRNRGPHALVHALVKYGKENFSIRTIKKCSKRTVLNRLEKHYILKYKTKAPNGYNITDGGDGTLGVKYTKEQHRKFLASIGTSRVGKGNSFFGKKHSKASKLRMRKSHLGKPAPWKEGWSHGTLYGYTTKKCRCVECKLRKKRSRNYGEGKKFQTTRWTRTFIPNAKRCFVGSHAAKDNHSR